ncbi:CD209 antigen-like [Ostrea edulis]|uniref:CD209 antigen-like n=1 Tax=Ostrea edulis TaxID=37623 RepID=UPI0024AEE47C|nr:CD209 antigen-like [Ostrea edulis]
MRNIKIIVLILSVYRIAGHTSLNHTKESFPRNTPGKLSNDLRNVLYQESIVRFSMVQNIQRLTMDVINIRSDRQTLKKNLDDMMEEVKTLETNGQRLQQENNVLKQNLTDLYATCSDNKRFTAKESQGFDVSQILTMQRQISVLKNNNDRQAMENENLRGRYLTLLQENGDFKHQLNEMNATLSQIRQLDDFNPRLQAIENNIRKLTFSTDVALNDIREDLNGSKLQLQNIPSEVWAACEKGWYQFEDNCYQFSNSSLTFNAAVTMCNSASKGAILLEIRSPEEENWIRLQMQRQGWKTTWIGITDSLDEGTFVFASSGNKIQNVHADWGRGEPGGGTGENCGLLLLKTKGWHDYPCSSKYRSICKKARV